ncbi:hypothetical protein SGRA_3253 [Saprospira grandis str. Lewin]|uniref:Uncharacterized protein n=1 Tax=Saprospira grandis (strain Lewin) TaxID=984262 RepID=H6KZX4_SAPGL|nr:hypothetical protein SGRA_3253 [Saprospira grandis str. Lewin]
MPITLIFSYLFFSVLLRWTGGEAAAKARSASAEGWIRGAEGQTELFEQSEKSEGPSRPASPDTARPERSEWAAPK